jgi:hypothetical protein
MPDKQPISISTQANESSNPSAQGLLNLLNWKLETGKENTKQPSELFNHPVSALPQVPSVSASDLVARYWSSAQRSDGTNQLQFSGIHHDGAGEKAEPPPQSSSLLNRSSSSGARSGLSGSAEYNPSQAVGVLDENSSRESTMAKLIRPEADSQTRRDSPIRLFGTTQSKEAISPKLEDRDEENKHQTIFTYKNPFDALHASRNQTPKPQTPTTRSSTLITKIEPKNPSGITTTDERLIFDSSPNPISTRRKLTPKIPGRTPSAVYESAEGSSNHVMESTQSSMQAPTNPKFSNGQTDTLQSSTAIENSSVGVPQLNDGIPEPESKPAQPEAPVANEVLENDTNENADVWESADDSPIKIPTKREVPVYNFPIKPFVSITLQTSPSSMVSFREDGIMEISRLKKEFDFDQIDRSLASATSKYISYALVKNVGIRIIRQDDGSDRQVFKNSHDRIFNVSFCSTAFSTPPSNNQAVLGTGVSGAVYYATVSKEGNDLFEKNMLDTESLIFPPFPPGDENASGGVLKTRAKKSSRHPEFFGIGRGKYIYIIWPATALSSKFGISATNRKVDVEKLYKERTLRITIGKAGKDFTFSEDDSLIASLDKTGILRFWDIRPLVNEATATAAEVLPIDIDTPLLTLSTAPPSEKRPKSWPTSVLFVDKLRPYIKGGALRYILVGLRQNHTLQLWDIALGKAVQELNFPHDSDSDGVCSVNYHPNSNIIVVGHPTRNSIYFIHLSAPRYPPPSMLPLMSQATYISRIANKDPEIPMPESTACMTGLREVSFADKGHLRSVELLHIYKPTDASKSSTQIQELFELYVVHSKGVTCLTITKEDLGWNSESKVLKPVDAEAEGFISLKELRLGSFVEEPIESKSQSEEQAQPNKPSKKKSPSEAARQSDDSLNKETEVETSQGHETPVFTNGSAPNDAPNDILNRETHLPKKSKKNKKKHQAAAGTNTTQPASRENSPIKQVLKEETPPPYLKQTSTMASVVQLSTSSAVEVASIPEPVTMGDSGDWMNKELKKIGNALSAEFQKELNSLYQNLQNDRNIQDSASAARQEAVLQLVSKTLSTNIEKSLSRMISAQMQQVVVPAITGVAVQAVTAQVGEAVAKVLHQLVPHELGTQMPAAFNTALQNPQISRMVAEAVSQKVAAQTEAQVADLLHKSIVPSFKNLAISAAEKAATDVEKRMSAQFRQLEVDRRDDVAKINKLSQALQGMAETMQAMSDSQVAFQRQILKDRQQFAHLSDTSPTSDSRPVSNARQSIPLNVSPPIAPSNNTKSTEEIEYDDISNLMNEGRYEEGSIKWLQSTQPVELFDNLFVRFTPEYLATDVSPLVAFSIAITVANSLSTNTARRIEWIETAFAAVDLSVSRSFMPNPYL